MDTFLAHVVSLAAIFATAWLALFRPVRNLLRTEARRMDDRVKEIETLAAAVKEADVERARTLKDIAETMDRIRHTSADFMRQEARKIVAQGIEEMRQRSLGFARDDKEVETFRV